MDQPSTPPVIVNWYGCVFPDDSSHGQIFLCELCGQQSEQSDKINIQSLCDEIFIFIFALATLYSDETTKSMSLVCRRLNKLVNTNTLR